MTKGVRGKSVVSGPRGREVIDGPRSREVLEGARGRTVATGPRGRTTGGSGGGGGVPNYFTGGIVTVSGGYRYHTFNSSGTLTFVDADGLGTAVDVDYLVVAGGGGGGGRKGGGGGAGGYQTVAASIGATQIVTVGAGGSGGGDATTDGTNGSDSSLGAISTATGGGRGAQSNTATSGGSGGSGGGGGRTSGNASGGSGTVGQGNDGGDGFVGSASGTGGGGGAGAAGADNSGANSGNGGNGSAWVDSITRAGGGGGGGATATITGTAGSGGTGGGGDGQAAAAGTAGAANTGGGGGGGGFDGAGYGGGAGGSGVVIVRYPDDPSMPTFFNQLAPVREIWAEDPAWTNPGDGGTLTTVRDAGSFAADLTAGFNGSGSAPTFVESGINGKPSFNFTRVNESNGGYLRTTSGTNQVGKSIVLVADYDESPSTAMYAVGRATGTDFMIVGAIPGKWRAAASAALTADSASGFDLNPHLFVARMFDNDTELLVDGVSVATDTAGTAAATAGLVLGQRTALSGYCFAGKISYYAQFAGDVTADPGYSTYIAAVASYYGITLP